jgi:hypothetical protein
MKLQEVKAIATQRGIDYGRMRKDELIKAIQRAERNNDCFGTALSIECGQISCLWRKDCLKDKAKGE